MSEDKKVFVDSIPYNSPELNLTSKQNWISVKVGKPDGRTGQYCGFYWCITERLKIINDTVFLRGRTGNYDKNVELCYWNDLADRFQDAKREYVKVTHWSPVPELPVHESKKVNRQIMLSAIADDEWLKIYYCDEAEEFYSPNHVYGLFAVSYDEILYVSIVNVNGKNNYMYATLTEKGRINRDAVLNVKKVNSHKSDEII